MKCCINGGNVIRLLFLSAKLLKFEIQNNYGQIYLVTYLELETCRLAMLALYFV